MPATVPVERPGPHPAPFAAPGIARNPTIPRAGEGAAALGVGPWAVPVRDHAAVTSAAHDVLAHVADRIGGLDRARPRRIAVDGITGAGKTTFAGRLVAELAPRGEPVVAVTMDGFHHPRAIRHRQGRHSADGYYEDAYDLAAIPRELLDPLGPDGARRIRRAVIDLATDRPAADPPELVAADAVLVVDGSFLQRPELRDGWDLVVYLRASFEAAAERGARRDAEALGGLDEARDAFRLRYHAAQRGYLAECNPEAAADVVIDVEDPTEPALIP